MRKPTAITNPPDPQSLARLSDIMHQAGQAANEQAARVAFEDQTAVREKRNACPHKARGVVRQARRH